MVVAMPNHKIGASYSFSQISAAYNADPQNESDAHYLLYRGDEVLALCLRHKYNPHPGEVWVGDDPAVATWGKTLAGLKGKRTIPLYYSPRGGKFYQFKGQYLVTGETDDPLELAKRKGPVPLSRIIYVKPVTQNQSAPQY
jgi:hypothetical protein